MGQGGGCVGKTHMLAVTNIPSRLATKNKYIIYQYFYVH